MHMWFHFQHHIRNYGTNILTVTIDVSAVFSMLNIYLSSTSERMSLGMWLLLLFYNVCLKWIQK